MYTVQMDHTLTRSETGRKTNLAKHYRARVFEKKGGRPYARLREAVRFTLFISDGRFAREENDSIKFYSNRYNQ